LPLAFDFYNCVLFRDTSFDSVSALQPGDERSQRLTYPHAFSARGRHTGCTSDKHCHIDSHWDLYVDAIPNIHFGTVADSAHCFTGYCCPGYIHPYDQCSTSAILFADKLHHVRHA
jgi:hypothetical protein